MILGPVSYLDCLVFCIFLTPQLIIHVGLLETVWVGLQCLPFLLLSLPTSFIRERFFVPREKQTPFVQVSSPFEDLVVRCVRYAFANVPPRVGRVFFSKAVGLPFLRFRMLRHGFLKVPVHWNEFDGGRFKGVWIVKDPMNKPDVCIYYAHGGGFSMGSPYFYLEFLLAWLSMLSDSGFRNPAIFALEYTLVPDSTFPTQLQEVIGGYNHVVSMVGDASRVCVSGDSAGGTIMLSLLMHLANMTHDVEKMDATGAWRLAPPRMAAFISPWVTLITPNHRDTASDFLDVESLQKYASEYCGIQVPPDDPLVSPGNCTDVDWWRKACPAGGMYFAYGAEEVFATEIERLVEFLQKNKIKASSRREAGGIHAWPVASLFLARSVDERLKGLSSLVQQIRRTMPLS